MSISNKVLVTGATGNVGMETTVRLLAEGVSVRALVRDPDQGREKILAALRNTSVTSVRSEAGRTEGDRAEELLECIRFDFLTDTPEARLFEGVAGIYLMRPPNIGDVKHYMFPFLRTARDAGVEHIVLLSLLGAKKLFFIPHRALEKEILRLRFRYHFLRAGFFMQNLDTVFDRFISEKSELPVPAGRGRTSFVDARDIGEAAARLLIAPGYEAGNSAEESSHPLRESWAPDITGRKAIDYEEVAQILSEELGRNISYRAPGLRSFRKKVLETGWEPEYAKIVGRLFFTIRFGMAAKVTDDIEKILGRPPRSLREYVRDYRAAWN